MRAKATAATTSGTTMRGHAPDVGQEQIDARGVAAAATGCRSGWPGAGRSRRRWRRSPPTAGCRRGPTAGPAAPAARAHEQRAVGDDGEPADSSVPRTSAGRRPVSAGGQHRAGTSTSGKATVSVASSAPGHDPPAGHRPQPEVDERAVLDRVAERGRREHERHHRRVERQAEGVDEVGAGVEAVEHVAHADGQADDDADERRAAPRNAEPARRRLRAQDDAVDRCAIIAVTGPPGSGRRCRGRRRAARARRAATPRSRAMTATVAAEAVDVGGLDLDASRGRRPARPTTTPSLEQRRRRSALGGVGDDAQAVGPVVHEVADGAEVALGGQAALGDDEDARAEPLHLVEHVAGHDDAAVRAGCRAGARGR